MAPTVSDMVQCFLCKNYFQFGPHVYDGKPLKKYRIDVCNNCLSANWDGLAPHYEKKFLKHLEENGLSVPLRNEKGWFPL